MSQNEQPELITADKMMRDFLPHLRGVKAQAAGLAMYAMAYGHTDGEEAE